MSPSRWAARSRNSRELRIHKGLGILDPHGNCVVLAGPAGQSHRAWHGVKHVRVKACMGFLYLTAADSKVQI